MDGYGIKGINRLSWRLIGSSRAGSGPNDTPLNDGEAIRVFTGALVPCEVETILMQEHVQVISDHLGATIQTETPPLSG